MKRCVSWPAAAAHVVALASVMEAQHPPVSRLYAEDDWVTLADFRHVTAVVASDEEAYVGTAGGVELLSQLVGRWSGTVTTGDGLPAAAVTALAFDAQGGNLWIGTPLGLAIYEPFRGEVIQDPLRLGSVPIRSILAVPGLPPSRAESRAPAMVTAPGEPRMYVLAGERWYRSDPFLRVAETVGEREVPHGSNDLDLREIPFLAGNILRGERSGQPESFRVSAAASLPGGRLVLGTWGANAYLYDPARLAAEPLAYGLAGPGGGALGWDGSRLWFSNAPSGTIGEGDVVDRLISEPRLLAPGGADRSAIAAASPDLGDWSYVYPGLEPGLPSDRAHDIAAAGGRTFFATDAGLAIYARETGAWQRLASLIEIRGEILAVEPASDGVWLGTRRGLVALRWEEGAGRDGARLPESARDSLRLAGRWLEDRSVLSLAGDGRDLFVGTDLGLFRLSPRQDDPAEQELTQVRTVGREIRDLALLEKELVVGSDRGVELLPRDAGEPLLFLVGEGRLDDPPLAVAADASNVWIGSRTGIARWDRTRRLWSEYGLADGLPDLPVRDILVQDSRTVWFSTPGGATRFDLGDPPRAR